MSDIRQLRIQPQSGAKLGTLKGGFEMDCAYRRGEAAAAEPAEEAEE